MEAPDPLFAFHAIREGLQRFLRNDVEYALDLFAEKRKSSILHAVGACMLYTFEGLITYDKVRIKAVAAMIDDAEKLCTKYAKTFVPAMQATPREKEYSKHLVELCQGVVLSLNASLKFASQGALDLLRAGLLIRKAFKLFKSINDLCVSWEEKQPSHGASKLSGSAGSGATSATAATYSWNSEKEEEEDEGVEEGQGISSIDRLAAARSPASGDRKWGGEDKEGKAEEARSPEGCEQVRQVVSDSVSDEVHSASEWRKELAVGAAMGLGSFSLVIALLPPKLRKAGKLLGTSGSFGNGFQRLAVAADADDTAFALIGKLLLVLLEGSLCLLHASPCGPYTHQVAEANAQLLREHPQGAFVQAFNARLLRGRHLNINDAVESAKAAYTCCQREWPPAAPLLGMELVWCLLTRGSLKGAAKVLPMLKDKPSVWSSSFITYLESIVQLQLQNDFRGIVELWVDTLHFAKEGHKTLEGIVAIIDKQEKQQSDAHLKAVVQRSKSMAPYLTHASEEERKSQEPQPHDKKKKKKEGKELGRIPMEKFAAGRAHRCLLGLAALEGILGFPFPSFPSKPNRRRRGARLRHWEFPAATMRDLVLPLALGGDPLLEVLVYWNILPSLTAPYLRSLLRRCFKMVTLYGWWLQRLSGHAAVKTAHTADIFRLSTSLHALTARVVTAAMGNDSLHRLASDWRGQWDELWQGLPVEQQEVIEMMLVSLHTASGGFTRSSKNGSGLLDAMAQQVLFLLTVLRASHHDAMIPEVVNLVQRAHTQGFLGFDEKYNAVPFLMLEKCYALTRQGKYTETLQCLQELDSLAKTRKFTFDSRFWMRVGLLEHDLNDRKHSLTRQPPTKLSIRSPRASPQGHGKATGEVEGPEDSPVSPTIGKGKHDASPNVSSGWSGKAAGADGGSGGGEGAPPTAFTCCGIFAKRRTPQAASKTADPIQTL